MAFGEMQAHSFKQYANTKLMQKYGQGTFELTNVTSSKDYSVVFHVKAKNEMSAEALYELNVYLTKLKKHYANVAHSIHNNQPGKNC